MRLPEIHKSDRRRTGLPSKLPPGLSDSPNSIVSDWLYTSNVSRIINFRFPVEKYKMPATTSQDVGWAWFEKAQPAAQADEQVLIRRQCAPQAPTLEIFGKHARGRGDVLKWFGAREALP